MAIDPVCGMEVDEQDAEFQASHAGKKFYFCSEECQNKFEKNPGEYSAASAA